MNQKNISIAFLGTPEFALPSLNALAKAYHIGLVVTAPHDPKKGAPPVAHRAEGLGLLCAAPEKITPSLFANTEFDFFVIAAYGKILPQEILVIPTKGVLNIHPSLLPRYRGPSPVQSAILAGDNESGVTIMLTDEKMDNGPILAQQKIPIEKKETSVSLTEKLADVGGELIVRVIADYLSGTITPSPQNHEKASFTKLLRKNDGRIDWQKNAEYIERLVRAYLLWPTAWTYFKTTKSALRIKLLSADIGEEHENTIRPGHIQIKSGDLFVAASDRFLHITELQLEGKNTMSGREFIRGYIKGNDAAFLSDI
ncbi:MAG TPA: methionyl-tRNA formyltransferase [Candidatus Paceibacterota bacterium]